MSGPAKTAYPERRAAADTARASPVPGADAPPPTPPATPLPEQVKEAQDINVIVMADTDLVDDRFWVQVQNLLGQRIVIPTADNGALVQNFVENMMGSNDLISLRTRERPTRPFVLVDNIRRQAESRFLAEERALQDRVTQTEASLRALQGQGGGDENPTGDAGAIGRAAETDRHVPPGPDHRRARACAGFRPICARTSKISGPRSRFLNIALVPVLVSAAAIGLAVLRKRRRNRARGA